MSPQTRGGHHGDVLYVFEDDGFDTDPLDDTPKIFGGNAIMDTFEGSHEAVRVFNHERFAAEIIEQVFDGAWSVSFDLGAEPPWWLAGVFGQPESTELVAPLFEHVYSLGESDPVPLRLYLPTDGFDEYEVVPGCVIATVTVDQTHPNNPDVTISGAYAREPFPSDALTLEVPEFSERTFSNRQGTVSVGNDEVGRSQNTNYQIETGAEMIGEIGSGSAVDFTVRAFEPDVTHDKILWVEQVVDLLERFKAAETATVGLEYNNGADSADEYAINFEATGAFPNSWSQTGRNDPEADLMEELQEMGKEAQVTVTVDEDTPPGVGA